MIPGGCFYLYYAVLSQVRLFGTPRTEARQAPLSMGVSRPEYWSGWPFPSPGDLSNPGTEPMSPTLQPDSLPSEPPGKPMNTGVGSPIPSAGDLPDPGIKVGSAALQVASLPGWILNHQGTRDILWRGLTSCAPSTPGNCPVFSRSLIFWFQGLRGLCQTLSESRCHLVVNSETLCGEIQRETGKGRRETPFWFQVCEEGVF